MDRLGWSGTSLAIVLIGLAAQASEPEPVEVAYDAPPGCPDRGALLREISARTARFRPAAPGELARRYRVAVSRTAAGDWEGRLELVDRDGRGATRTVTGGSCAEAVGALALVSALAIDALFAEEPPHAAPSASPPGPAASAPVPSASAAESYPTPPSITPRPPTRRATPRPTDASQVRAGVVALGATAVAPGLGFGAGIPVELRASEGGALARLTPFALFAGRRDVAGGAARFSLLGGRADACLPGAALGERLRLRPCASLEAGALEARGVRTSALTRPERASLPWLALGPSARLDVRADERVGLELALGAFTPLRREAFVMKNVGGLEEVEVHEIPWLGGWAAASVSVALGR
ncbi:MAG: hypothetical protein IT376_05295 [Polyangiaceae bacterium]|nr:hypothetical protein [Polyangiaceae bacterium]